MGLTRPGAPVVVGIDGSEPALAATRWAATEAARHGVGLRLVTAFGWRAPSRVDVTVPGVDPREVLLQTARAEQAKAAAVAIGTAPGIEVRRSIVDGYPVPRLTAASRDAQLVVVGDRSPGGPPGRMVAVGLATRAACPVVVVRGGQPEPSAPVVVGVDGSAPSDSALEFAIEAAAARRAPLVAVHVWRDESLDANGQEFQDWEAAECERVLGGLLAGWGEKYPDVEIRRVAVKDRPAHALVQHCADAQLLVVGSRGRGGMVGLLLGSVAQTVLHRAPCPVVVVRPHPSEELRR
jgi:nucleotide-binding universal stress UspA family protein